MTTTVRVQHDEFSFSYEIDHTTVTNGLQQSATFWHHQSGLTQTASDFAGALTEIEFDENLDARSLSYEGSRVASIDYVDHKPVSLIRQDRTTELAYSYEYADGRLRSVETDGIPIAEYRYDASGAVIRAFDSNGERRYSLSPDGRIRGFELNGVRTGLSPNEIGLVGGFRINGQTLAQLSYDAADRVAEIHVGDNAVTYEYAAIGFRKHSFYGDVGRIDYTYDDAGNLRESTFDIEGYSPITDTYDVGPANQLRQILAEPGEDVSFSYDQAGRVSTVSQGSRYAEISRDDVGRVVGLEIDGKKMFGIDYSPMAIDAVVAADVKSNRVRSDLPIVPAIFGSLEAIAYSRAIGTAYGLISFAPSMGRFVIAEQPYISPDSVTLSSIQRRAIPTDADMESLNVLAVFSMVTVVAQRNSRG